MHDKKAYSRMYNAKPETKARATELRALPSYRAKVFVRQVRRKEGMIITFEAVMPWFAIPKQDRVCWLCLEPINDNSTLDHDHLNGEIRGWTHVQCNTAEGMIANSPNPEALVRSFNLLYHI